MLKQFFTPFLTKVHFYSPFLQAISIFILDEYVLISIFLLSATTSTPGVANQVKTLLEAGRHFSPSRLQVKESLN